MYTPTKELMDALVSELELARKIGRGEGGFNAERKFDHERRNLQQVIENQKAVIDRSASTRSKAGAWDKVIAALVEAAGEPIVSRAQGMSLADAAVKYIKQLAKEAFNVDDQKAELRREHRRQLQRINEALRKEGFYLVTSDYGFKYERVALMPFPPLAPPGKPYASVNLGPDWHGIPIDDPADTKPVSELDTVKMERDLSIAEFDALSRDLAKLGITVKVRDDGSYAGVDYDKLGSGA